MTIKRAFYLFFDRICSYRVRVDSGFVFRYYVPATKIDSSSRKHSQNSVSQGVRRFHILTIPDVYILPREKHVTVSP